MKRITLGAIVIILGLASCNGGTADTDTSTSDTVGLTNPVAIDTTKHPDGVANSNVTSSDTAAMNTSNAYKKLDSAKKAH